ncbi:MAG: hypothetical protein ACK52K_18430 [Alphaproteobacteria bacterium]|jgi:TRAP-type uncharacterized transport system fused permease subunit
MKLVIEIVIGALNFFPGYKTRVAAIASVISALVVAVSAALSAFGAGFTIPYLNEVNALLIALTAVGAANQPNNLPKP